MILIIARFVLVFAVLLLVGILIAHIAKSSTTSGKEELSRKYEKRFDPESNQYYIVKVLKNKEEPVCRWYGKRILYKDLIKVEYVLEKLNNIK